MPGQPIKVAVVKETKDTRVGITFRQDADQDILINTIEPSSLFANTALKPGMELLRINGVTADCLSLSQVMKAVRESPDVITIEACEIEKETYRKPQPSAPLEPSSVRAVAVAPTMASRPDPEPMQIEGFEYDTSQEPTLIVLPEHEVQSNGRSRNDPTGNNLSNSAIPVASAQIVTGYDETSPGDDEEAQLQETVAEAYAPAEQQQSTTTRAGVLVDRRDTDGTVTVTATKPSPDTLVGVGLGHQQGIGVVVNSIKTFSIMTGTNLRVGMQLLSVNGTDCFNLTNGEVAAMLRSIEGNVTIVARQPTGGTARGSAVTAMAIPEFSLTTAEAVKPRQDSKVGISIYDKAMEDGKKIPVINRVNSDGLFASSALQPGMRVLQINGISCRGRDDSIAMLRMATGRLTVVAGSLQMVAATVTKSTRQSTVGLAMQRKGEDLLVTRLLPESPFIKTDLKVGMRILQINGNSVRNLASNEVLSIIANAEGTVSVLAESIKSQDGLVVATITKPSMDSRVGLGVIRKGGNLVVSSLPPHGLFHRTALKVGMKILQLNGSSVEGLSASQVAAIIASSEGTVTVVAERTNSSLVIASVTKPTQDTKVGLTMVRKGGDLVVSGLPPNGLFAQTDLQVGMRILKINGNNVKGLDADEVLGIISSSEGIVRVLAEKFDKRERRTDVIAPPGAPPGGEWGTGEFFGPVNSLWYCIVCSCCGIFGLCTFCCKCDKDAMYRAPNGKIYNQRGVLLATNESEVHFRHNPPGITGPQEFPVSEIEKSCGPNYRQILLGIGTAIFVIWFVISLILRLTVDEEDSYYSSSSYCRYQYCYEYTTCYNAYSGTYESCYEYQYVYRCGGC